jgi:GTP:adenosylcobinamide-phosphate guanylyltransferase
LAGTDDNPKRLIRGQNKAFLEISGEMLVRGVVSALLDAQTISRVYVVGPEDRLHESLDHLASKVEIVPQAGKMLANCWAAINASEAHYLENHSQADPERPLLIISCDLPLISGQAVDDFVARCARIDNQSGKPTSMHVGVAEESALKGFYADGTAEGIIRPYVHLEHCLIRLANIYVSRPRTLTHHEFLEEGFTYRKAKDWRNVMSLAWKFLGQSGGWNAAWITLKLQLTLIASKRWKRLYRWLRKHNSEEQVERACGVVLGGSVRIVYTPYGGLSLDVDNENDFRILSARAKDWSRVLPVEFIPSLDE